MDQTKSSVLSPRPASYASVCIQTFFKDSEGAMRPVSNGTGFFIKIEGIKFLVTNWHVVTGRDPNNPHNTLPNIQTSPTHFQIHLASNASPKHFRPLDYVSLYDQNGNAAWLESPMGPKDSDIVAIPGAPPEECKISLVEYSGSDNPTILQPGLDVVLIGFPFGIIASNPFPVWKRAMIASEPSLLIDGKPFAYLDTPGRPGMSGSPVYISSDGFLTSNKLMESLSSHRPLDVLSSFDISELKNRTTVLEFAGIYAGSLGNNELDSLNLGRFFPRYHLEAISKKGKRGNNPFPPEFFESV